MKVDFCVFDWQAFSALATAAGVLVALFLPFLQEYIRNRKIIDSLRREYMSIRERLIKIKTLKEKKIVLQNGENVVIRREQLCAALLKWIKHPLWNEYYTKLAVTKMKKDEVEKIKKFYDELDDIIDMFINPQQPPHKQPPHMLQVAIVRLDDLIKDL